MIIETLVYHYFLAENREKTPVEEEISRIRARFDDIVSILESRGVILEATLTDAEAYQTLHTDLIGWLESAEEVQRSWAPVGNDLITIRRQYAEHQVTFIFLVLNFMDKLFGDLIC